MPEAFKALIEIVEVFHDIPLSEDCLITNEQNLLFLMLGFNHMNH
jgi:hypothetical protein